ncbi:MAG TPA: NUDIX domain-containing protein [Pseudomonadales bacterium]
MTRDRFPTVVHVLLLRGRAASRSLFLLRRSGTGFMDGWHVLPGGHVRAGESLAEAAARECGEETGVVPRRLEPLCVLPYRSGAHQGINMVFEGRGLDAEPGIGEPASCDEAGWYPLGRLPEPVAPWIGDVLDLRARGEWFRELYWP